MTWFMAQPHKRLRWRGRGVEPGARAGVRETPCTPFPAFTLHRGSLQARFYGVASDSI